MSDQNKYTSNRTVFYVAPDDRALVTWAKAQAQAEGLSFSAWLLAMIRGARERALVAIHDHEGGSK